MLPLFSPLRQNEEFLGDFAQIADHVFRSGQYILGPEVSQFETQLAETLGYKNAIGCSSGTCALIAALKALDLPAGSEIITSSFSFVASASSIVWAGHRVRFVDVDPETGCMSVETLKKALTAQTRAIVVVDLFGRQHEVKEIVALCKSTNVFVIEDGAQSIGVPNVGADFYTTSFYPTKNVGAIGDAGAILTDSDELAKRARTICLHGAEVRDHHSTLGFNGRLDTLQAALLLKKLPHIEKWTQSRRQVANTYLDGLRELADSTLLTLPPNTDSQNVWALFTVQLDDRNSLIRYLKDNQIASAAYYSEPLNTQPVLSDFASPCPNAELLSKRCVSIPCFPELKGEEISHVIKTIHAFFDQHRTA